MKPSDPVWRMQTGNWSKKLSDSVSRVSRWEKSFEQSLCLFIEFGGNDKKKNQKPALLLPDPVKPPNSTSAGTGYEGQNTT